MSENNLSQFAQMIAELPIQNTTPNNQHHNTQKLVPPLPPPPQQQQQQPLPSTSYQLQHQGGLSREPHRYLHIRKNACVVCSICFTCSKYYGIDCTCQEIQPRRGKNLPEGGLDSRAKKLHRTGGGGGGGGGGDQDDYEFSIGWINENAHQMYKDQHDQVVGLRELSEVSLCKAHSSTLYRAKKRHERLQQLQQSGGSGTTTGAGADFMQQSSSYLVNSGGLAAKVKELNSSSMAYQGQQRQPRMMEMPDFSRLSHSTSNKRKRTSRLSSPNKEQVSLPTTFRPNSSISTPLLYSGSSFSSRPPPPPPTTSSPFMQQPMSQEFQQAMQQQQQQIVDNNSPFPSSSQLPPLHSHQQQQIYPPPTPTPTTTTSMTITPRPPISTKPTPTRSSGLVIETVSLRSSTNANYYYFKNLAITDTFTFRDLLQEIDMTGSPPPGKRIVISDQDKFYPLDQAIRSVIKRPISTHLDLALGLTDKPSINWSYY